LRHDNADQRLTARAFATGLVKSARWAKHLEKVELLDLARSVANQTKLNGIPISHLFKRPDFNHTHLPREIAQLVPFSMWQLVETDFKYQGYAARQADQNRHLERHQQQAIPSSIDYGKIPGLRAETRLKLATARPESLGQASRISGVTPADISIIHIWLVKRRLEIVNT
jgi:tRNA uridine 5-carboxymethylaminomethyl modification enzyme